VDDGVALIKFTVQARKIKRARFAVHDFGMVGDEVTRLKSKSDGETKLETPYVVSYGNYVVGDEVTRLNLNFDL